MNGCTMGGAIMALAVTIGPGLASVIDFDDPDAEPLHFAVETVSGEVATTAEQGAAALTYYNLEASAEDAALTTTTGRCRGPRSAARRPSWS